MSLASRMAAMRIKNEEIEEDEKPQRTSLQQGTMISKIKQQIKEQGTTKIPITKQERKESLFRILKNMNDEDNF